MVKKAQSSIEFFILVGALLFFFLSFLYSVQTNISEKTRTQLNLEVKDLALQVVDEINLASRASDGYIRNFSTPSKVANRDYTINASTGAVYLVTDDGKFAISFPIEQIKGEIVIGANVIRKVGGEIYLN